MKSERSKWQKSPIHGVNNFPKCAATFCEYSTGWISCSDKGIHMHMLICKTHANLYIYIILLWQEFALFARARGGNMHSCTKLFDVLNIRCQWHRGRKLAKRLRRLGKLACADVHERILALQIAFGSLGTDIANTWSIDLVFVVIFCRIDLRFIQ